MLYYLCCDSEHLVILSNKKYGIQKKAKLASRILIPL